MSGQPIWDGSGWYTFTDYLYFRGTCYGEVVGCQWWDTDGGTGICGPYTLLEKCEYGCGWSGGNICAPPP